MPRPLTIDTLRADAEAFLEELSREQHLALAGHKPTAELQAVYARHARAHGEDALEMVHEAFGGATPGSEAHRSARLLLEWLAEAHASRQLAAHDERELEWEARAMVRLPEGGELPYQRAAIAMANAAERGERLRIEKARAGLVERELAPLKRERLQREKSAIESLGIADGYVPTFEALSGIALEPLAQQCRAFLRDTQGMWDDTLRDLVKARLGIAPAEATRADALHLFRLGGFDHAFPAGEMEAAVRRQVAEMGLDPDAGGRVRYDLAEREGKRSRAFCAPVRVPEEVHLVLRPFGGQQDWTTLLHELGHALHFATMRADMPLEHRWMGDNSITEGWAMLFDHLMQDRRWLTRYTRLEKREVPEFLRAVGAVELHFLRRYSAKLLYELALYADDARWDDLPDLYAQSLTDATTFRYGTADAFVDVDPRFYAARYLRAWQLQALVTATLVEHHDEDWFRNPRAGPWIAGELMAPGQRETADELAQRVTGRTLSFDPLVASVERLLGA